MDHSPINTAAARTTEEELRERFGSVPNFYRLVPETPEITESLWGFAKAGYLDNPLPALFKERLFVYLSRYCEARYCIARHVGFLMGLGGPSGNRHSPPPHVEQVVRLLCRPLAEGKDLGSVVAMLMARESAFGEPPSEESVDEAAVFACATHVFLQTAEAAKCLSALRVAFDPAALQHILVFLTFVRTAHFWTLVHPELENDDDVRLLLDVHEALSRCILNDPAALGCAAGQKLLPQRGSDAQELQRQFAALQASEEKYRRLFESIDEGYCVFEMLYDEAGEPHDYRFIEVNPAFERHTGLKSAQGKTILELVPNHEKHWFETYGKVVTTGQAVRFENRGEGMQRWFEVYAFRVGGSESKKVAAVFSDTTERKLAEESLCQSEGRFRALVTASSDVVYWMSPDWSEMRHLQGREFIADTLEPSQTWLDKYIHPDDQTDVLKAIDRAIVTRSPFELEHRVLRIDGTQGWTFSRAVPIFNERAEITEWLGAAVDITDRKQGEETLRSSALRYHTLFDAMDEGYCIIEMLFDDQQRPTDYRFIEVNGSFERQSGMHDVVGKRMLEFVPEIEPHWLNNYGEVALTGKAIRFEGEYKGLHRYFEVYAFRAAGWPEHHVAVLFADVTQRKQIEGALLASEAVFRTLGESLPDFLWMSDGDGRPIYQNPAWRSYTGFSQEQLARVGWRALAHPDDLLRLQSIWREATSSGHAFKVEYRCRRHDGEYRWFLARTVPVKDDSGKVIKWVGTGTDIHDQKRLEASLKEADRRKDEFLATLAHELRNPLAPIRNSLHILRISSDDGGATDRVHEMLERQVNHMVRLVDDLMEVSRITRGKIELKKEHIDLAAVIRSGVETSKPLIEAAGHHFTINVPTEPLALEADPVRLAQVLSNLLNNAAKYTEPGGHIWLTARRQGTDALISVRDSGSGIPADMLVSVFDLFTQVDRTYDRSQGGLGIGLTLVKSLVEMHGGSIKAESDGLGQGSEFVVRLPLATQAADTPVQHPRGNQSPSVAPRRILVVDDNRDAADSLRVILQFLGSDVQTASDGVAALKAMRTFRPSVVLLDIGMPEMDGFEVARRARQQLGGEGITLIALTGWGQEDDRRRSKEAGFDYHLVKPVDLGSLQALLASLPHEARSPAETDRPC